MELVAERRIGHRIRIIGFSCVHFGDRQGHDAPLWHRCLDEIEQTDNAVVFGLGDYLDWTRTSHRAGLRAVWGEDDKAFQQVDDKVMDGLVYPFVDIIRKHCPSFAKKCIGLVEGNHHGTMLSSQFRNGWTTTQEICRLLDVPYLGLSAGVRLTVYRSVGTKKFGTGNNLNFLLNHSVSSSGRLAASLASAQRKLEGWRDVDVFLTANDHQLGHVLRQEMGWTQRGTMRQIEYQQVIGKVGSFQKAYQVGALSDHYVEKKLLSPNQLGWLAFDAWIHHRELTQAEKVTQGVTQSPEVWRFSNFSG